MLQTQKNYVPSTGSSRVATRRSTSTTMIRRASATRIRCARSSRWKPGNRLCWRDCGQSFAHPGRALRLTAQELSAEIQAQRRQTEQHRDLNELEAALRKAGEAKNNAHKLGELYQRFQEITPKEQQAAWAASDQSAEIEALYTQVESYLRYYQAFKRGMWRWKMGNMARRSSTINWSNRAAPGGRRPGDGWISCRAATTTDRIRERQGSQRLPGGSQHAGQR